MDNVYKRHLFKVYSSADEGIDDVNELQDEYKSMSSEEDCVLFGLEVGDVFESCDSAEKQVVYCAKNNGFEVKKFRLKKNKKEIVCRTFKCKFFGVYRVQKKADIEDTHECKSVRMNCPWNINLQLTGDLIYVTLLCNKHSNHSLEKENFVSNRQLSSEILEEIKFLVNIGCEASLIIHAFQKHFPETVIHLKYVYNAICHFWNIQNKSKLDAAKTFKKLMKLQREEHR
ncbi:4765_t:CDS:1 [Rhizophagus irregularis]|uniref:FAR1 domain-containing protein n=2 Tax=Rhizophagus irregularis TaxID=588596 RepID=A0A015KXA8_RHIIW|nr:hypothetical protein RirG_140860 [Rhizophagus irregularis DAOM 197198w]CAG8738709.1 4765_t:CDS:1 [Rhizophagus irregularis]